MDMETSTPHDRTSLRAMLRQAEQSRRAQAGIDFYWDAARWSTRLSALINREAHSDAMYQRQISDLVVGSETQIALEQHSTSCVDDDIAWYTRLLEQLCELQAHWEAHGLSNSTDYADLIIHKHQLELRLLERRVYLYQLWLEHLERRRQQYGGLKRELWAQYWGQLCGLFDQQAAHYADVYNQRLPRSTLEARRAWLVRLRALQRSTEHIWRDNTYFDAQSYRADARTVEQAIARLTLVETPARGVRTILIALGAAVVIGLCIALIWPSVSQPAGGLHGKAQVVTPLIGVARAPEAAQDPQPSHIDPAAAVAFNRNGVAQLQRGGCDQALVQFEQAIAADPSFYEPLSNSAFCLYDQGHRVEAIARWRKALALNAASPDVNAGLGMALYVSGNVDEGRRYYQAALRVEPRYRDAAWMQYERLWSARALADSAGLRAGT